MPGRSHLTLDTIATWSGLVANMEHDPGTAKLAQQLRQRCRRICDFSVFADLGAAVTLCHRNRYRILVDVQAHILH